MSTNAINSLAGNTNNNTATNQSTRQTGAEANMFMTLLVAQLKNQDPLQPQDGAAFVAQLAQFNSLDQLVGIKKSLEELITLTQNHTPTQNDSSKTSEQTPTFRQIS